MTWMMMPSYAEAPLRSSLFKTWLYDRETAFRSTCSDTLDFARLTLSTAGPWSPPEVLALRLPSALVRLPAYQRSFGKAPLPE